MRLWPDSLASRLIALLLLALALAQVVSLLVFSHERGRAAELSARQYVQNRVVSTVNLLADTPAEQRRAVLRRANTAGLRVHLARQPRRIGPPETAEERALAGHLREALGASAGAIHVRLRGGRDVDRPLIAIAVQLTDGPWLLAVKILREPPPQWSAASLLALLLSALFIVVAVILGVRGITASLRRLSDAADRLGRGERLPALPETGPADLRRTAAAFNRMQARLERFLSDRTRMLAAVSHDLRTPITALRLRAEFIEDDDNRAHIQQTLDDMQRITEATLDFARSETGSEASQSVNLSVLIERLASGHQAMGHDVSVSAPGDVTLTCRRSLITRALRNLIDNALTYGGRAKLTLNARDDRLAIHVADAGPGIPAADRERVFDPFVRLEGSRNAETGGVGLGLSIARGAARAHGGDIRFVDDPQAGFTVVLSLPREQTGSALS